MTNDEAEPLSAEEIADLLAKAKAATPGPYFVAADEAEDAPDHRGSGLALVDTGRLEDWPIARLIEWNQAHFIEAVTPEVVQRFAATLDQRDEQIKRLRKLLIDRGAASEALTATEPSR